MLFKFVFLSAVIALCNSQRVKIAVYYESLCSDSAKFFVDQLHPTLRGPLGKYLELTLNPFGNANFSTRGADVEFTCQHGPNECYGNKVHACALHHIQVDSYQNTQTRETLSLDYTTCLLQNALNSNDAPFPGFKCARELQLKNWNVIEQCANSTEGSKFLQSYGEDTFVLKPRYTEVPWIILNQEFTEENQKLSVQNLRAAVCNNFRDYRPQECSAIGGAATNHMAFAFVLLSAATVLVTKLFQF